MLNIQHAIMIKESSSDKPLKLLLESARANNIHIAEFTREMLETTNDKIVIEKTKSKNYDTIEHLGVLVFGNRKEVEKLTESFILIQ